jgi:glycosyltransferase involved in cell wall biosynthesis
MAPIRVLIDARMLLGKFSGVARFVTRIVDELAQREDMEVVALCGEEAFEPWILRNDIEVVHSSFTRRDRTAGRRVLWEESRLPRLIRETGVDVYHATWNTGVPMSCSVPSVLTVHDLIPWHDPKNHFRTARSRWSYRYAMRAGLRRASVITTVSAFTRQALLKTFALNDGKVIVTPNGADSPKQIEHNVGSPASPPFALYVGGHEPRKNLGAVIRAVALVRTAFRSNLTLRLTGLRSDLDENAQRELAECAPSDWVTFLGQPDDRALAREYASAAAILMLSKEEGFGLPVIEAMARGCPVIAADRTALPEVVGDAGILVDPDNTIQVADAIWRVMTCKDTRHQLVDRGLKQAARFQWSRTADLLMEAYRLAASSRAERETRSGERMPSSSARVQRC